MGLRIELGQSEAAGDWPFRVRCMSSRIVVMTGRDQLSLATGDLTRLLHSAFGFSSFRPNQETVCRAAIEGQDVLHTWQSLTAGGVASLAKRNS